MIVLLKGVHVFCIYMFAVIKRAPPTIRFVIVVLGRRRLIYHRSYLLSNVLATKLQKEIQNMNL